MGSPSWDPGHGTEVSIYSGLQDRFANAGLLSAGSDGHIWSGLLMKSVSPLVPDCDVTTFFDQIYAVEESDD